MTRPIQWEQLVGTNNDDGLVRLPLPYFHDAAEFIKHMCTQLAVNDKLSAIPAIFEFQVQKKFGCHVCGVERTTDTYTTNMLGLPLPTHARLT